MAASPPFQLVAPTDGHVGGRLARRVDDHEGDAALGAGGRSARALSSETTRITPAAAPRGDRVDPRRARARPALPAPTARRRARCSRATSSTPRMISIAHALSSSLKTRSSSSERGGRPTSPAAGSRARRAAAPRARAWRRRRPARPLSDLRHGGRRDAARRGDVGDRDPAPHALGSVSKVSDPEGRLSAVTSGGYSCQSQGVVGSKVSGGGVMQCSDPRPRVARRVALALTAAAIALAGRRRARARPRAPAYLGTAVDVGVLERRRPATAPCWRASSTASRRRTP